MTKLLHAFPNLRRFAAGALAALVVCLVASAALAESITVTYSFDRPQLESVTLGGVVYDRIVMKGAPNGGLIGQPALPASGAQILLPPGAEVTDLRVVTGERLSLGTGYFIEPIAPQGKLTGKDSEFASQIVDPIPDATIYTSSVFFPSHRAKQIGAYDFRGYRLLVVRLQPVEFNPETGEVAYYSEVTITVETQSSGKASSLFRGQTHDELAIKSRVDNPEDVALYPAAGRADKSFDLLILTTSAMASAFQPLADYHNAHGIVTEIHTTDMVGSTAPDNVRSYIRDRYSNDGISWVIIGADDDIIPAKDLYVEMSPGGEAETAMPGDLYFSCLDGVWNYDGDTQWGEPNDGDGGGDVDLVAEVYVGRASVGNVTEATRFVNKTLTYFGASGQYLQEVLLVGEYLGFGGIAEYGGNYLDELPDGSSEHGYTTTGIPSALFNIERLYERDGNWTQSDLVQKINSGIHILNHLGHGDTDYAMKLYNSDISSLITNTDLCFVYSQTCLAGHLDGTDCWAEYMNIKIDGGAFAVIMNARYGFGEFNSTDGASQRFNREFWDAIFDASELKPELGRALADSKEDNIYRVNDDYMRWVYYEENLFGDPTVTLVTQGGIAFDYPDSLPGILLPNLETTFRVTVEGVYGGSPVDGTGQLHYRVSGGEWQITEMLEVGMNEYEATLPALACGEYIEYYVSAEEVEAGRFYDPRPTSPRRTFPATAVAAAFADDFETDRGWTPQGSWARGIPTGGGGEYGNPDPTTGHNAPNIYGYNLSGDYTNNMSEMNLTSPAFDCSDFFNVTLTFWRYLGVEQPSYDHAYIRVSTNGSTWTTIWENTSTISDAAWTQVSYDLSAIADGQPTVFLRFTMGVTDGAWLYCGWNIDDLSISGYTCEANPDTDNDGVLNADDNCPLAYNPDQTDSDGDLVGDSCDACPGHDDSADVDSDGIADGCDACPGFDDKADYDGDLHADGCDNCPQAENPDQKDTDGDGIGDACCCTGAMGNVDCSGDDTADMGDLTAIIDHLFISNAPLCCGIEADLDKSDGATMSDLTILIDHLFLSYEPLQDCGWIPHP